MPKASKRGGRDDAGASEAAAGGSPSDDYYLSAGHRIPLKRDPEMVGVLLEHPSVADSGLREALEREGRELREGITLAPLSTIPPDRRERLEEDGALLPVYEQDGASIVVLPEVRIEGVDHKQLHSIKAWLDGAQPSAEFVEERGTRLTVRPRSGRASDALRIANDLDEEVHPALSQARFLRVVPER